MSERRRPVVLPGDSDPSRKRQAGTASLKPKHIPPQFNAIIAAASVMTSRPAPLRAKLPKSDEWQEDAWRIYDNSGELRFAVGWIANGLSRVNLTAARRPETLGDEPSALTGASPIETDAIALVAAIAGGPDGQAQLLARLATLLSIPGIGWVLIENPGGKTKGPDEAWSWRVLSSDEMRDTHGDIEVEDPEADLGWRALAGAYVLIKVWRAHARHSSKPDSSARGALRPLRQLALLDDHIDATAQSRLAGAGLLVVPTEVEFNPVASSPPDPDDPDAIADPPVVDDFVDVLIETMTTPIADRSSAAAVVPLTIKVPGEYVDKVQHITFWSEFSDSVLGLGERAIERFALAMDMPPEVITGVSDMNHWGAWRVQEEAVTLHIDPLAAVIGSALTTGYLRPGLLARGHDPVEVDQILVGHDATNLTVRPDLSDDTLAAYDRIEASSKTLRREVGLSETDAPNEEEWRRRYIMRVIDRSPQLAPYLLPELGIDAGIPLDATGGNGNQPYPQTEEQAKTTPERQIGGPPDTNQQAAGADRHLSADGLVAACDGIVYRALEIGGRRLHNKASRKDGGTVIDCGEPTTFHTRFDVSSFSNVHELLTGAWDRVPEIADRYGVAADDLLLNLDSYARGLLVNGQPHDVEALRNALPLHNVVVG